MKVKEIYKIFNGRVDIEWGNDFENELTLNDENINNYKDYEIIEINSFSYYGYGYEGFGITLRINMEENKND